MGTACLPAQVLALLERIKRQDAGEVEPPAIAIGGFRGPSGDSDEEEDESDEDDEIVDDLEVCSIFTSACGLKDSPY